MKTKLKHSFTLTRDYTTKSGRQSKKVQSWIVRILNTKGEMVWEFSETLRRDAKTQAEKRVRQLDREAAGHKKPGRTPGRKEVITIAVSDKHKQWLALQPASYGGTLAALMEKAIEEEQSKLTA